MVRRSQIGVTRNIWADRVFGFGVVVLLVSGFVLRMRLLLSPAGRLDSDEATVALMADWISHGHIPPLFYWGQHYGGTGEPTLVALALKIHRSAMTLKVVSLVLSAIGAWLTTRVGYRVLRDRWRARVAGALVFGWPGTVLLATKSRGIYWLTFVCVVAAVLCAVRIVDKDRAGRWPTRDAVLFGFLVGFAFYQNGQSAVVLGPTALWLVVRQRPDVRSVGIVAASGALGATQWFIGWAKYGSAVFDQPFKDTVYSDRLYRAYDQLLPRILGLRRSQHGDWLIDGLGRIVYRTLLVVALLVAFKMAYTRVRAFRASEDREDHRSFSLVLLIVGSYFFLITYPTGTYSVYEPRYALLAVPFLGLFVAAAAKNIAMLVLIVTFVLSFGIANTREMADIADHLGYPDLGVTSPNELLVVLHRRNLTRVYADYWLCYGADFEANGSVVLSSIGIARDPQARKIVDSARSRVWVLTAYSNRDKAMSKWIAVHSVRARRVVDGRYVLFYFERYLDPIATHF